jgi:hypothetical protein
VLVVQLVFVQEIRLINGGRCIDYYWVLGIGYWLASGARLLGMQNSRTTGISYTITDYIGYTFLDF